MSIITWLTRLCGRSPPPAPSSHRTTPVAPPPGRDVSLPDIDNPDRQHALAVWHAYREHQPELTWVEFMANLEASKRQSESEFAQRKVELARLTSKPRFRP